MAATLIAQNRQTALALAQAANLHIATYNPGDGVRIKVMPRVLDYHAHDGLYRSGRWIAVVAYLRGYLDGRASR